jgi:hypothetical protein
MDVCARRQRAQASIGVKGQRPLRTQTEGLRALLLFASGRYATFFPLARPLQRLIENAPPHLHRSASVPSIDDTIAALETKLKQAKARKQLVEARKRMAEQKVSRRQDTRRKVLVGAVILARVERGEWPRDKLLALLDSHLTRADDRALFDLPGAVEGPAPSQAS